MKKDKRVDNRDLLRQAKDVYSKGGAAGFARKAFYYVRSRLSKQSEGVSFQAAKSYATDKRWQHIKNNLSEDDKSLLDIGCDSGALTSRSADLGILTIGIDKYPDDMFGPAEREARSRARMRSNMGIVKKNLTPTSMRSIPIFDVVLMLGVHHYWHCQYGEKGARKMIRSLRGSRKIFFSSSSRKGRYESLLKRFSSNEVEAKDIPDIGNGKESVIRYYTSLIEDELGEEYKVKLICSTKYDYETRHMLLAEKTRG